MWTGEHEEAAVVVETTYVPGHDLLLGTGDHWILMTDPGDEDVVSALWETLTTAPASASVVEQVLALLEKAFDGDPPGLALVDMSGGSSTAVSRGRGHVRVVGPSRILSLDGGADAAELAPVRRLVGGVVAASRAEVRPVTSRVAPPPASISTALPPPAEGLIDGIPDEILAAKGPEGPPPPRPRRVRATPAAEQPAAPYAASPAAVPGHDTDPRQDTGPLLDTTDPGQHLPRIEEGGHTTIRPSAPAPHAAGDVDDHDGSTVNRPAQPGVPPPQGGPVTVLAVHCPQGHPTTPARPACRVCHQPVAPQEPRWIPRPMLGGLRLPTGEVVPLDRGVVLGRKPAPVDGSHDWPHLVHLPRDHTFVSRMHLQIELAGWDVLARDLGSRGGTMLTPPGRPPQRLAAGEAYVLEPGSTLDLADVYEVRFEVGPAVVGR
ncbi:hypothetical protein DDE18_03455 [Nocardioides gansuensis]|uniref:FHA domain-containing protein n=1 Tax=Nocardioides gansuensis TaxID=2138300 RepID=A0A2T8FG18_9ACTN|nr:hypothetical protein DDE18_03455 [Nocardioides gansuensis]